MAEFMTPMETFAQCVDKYRKMLEFCSGCGDRAAGYEASAWKDLQAAYNALTDADKANVTLPARQCIANDGTDGIFTGYTRATTRYW